MWTTCIRTALVCALLFTPSASRAIIIAAAVLCFVETSLVLALLIQGSRRSRAEQALLQSRNDVRTLAGKLIDAQEEERRRIARELHDDLSQELAAVGILVSSIIEDVGGLVPQASSRFKEL